MCSTQVEESSASDPKPARGASSLHARAWLLLLALFVLLPGCEGDRASQAEQASSSAFGTLQLPLTMVTPTGKAFRLNATFEIRGPASFTLRTQDFAEEAPSLVQTLPVGRYTVTLQPGFELAERTELGFAAVTADLLSPASQRVDVHTGATAQLAYRFGTRAPVSDAGPQPPGDIEVVFTVEEAIGPCTLPAPRQIAVNGVLDVAFDGKRCRLYAATSGGTIFVHDLLRQETRPLLKVAGSLGGMDISPNQDTLLAANRDIAALHRIDLRTTSPDLISFTPAFYEGGTFAVVFGDDTTAFTTSTFQGSGWVPLRRVNLADSSYATIASVRQNTTLALSANGARLAFAEANISSGDFGSYALADGTFARGATNTFLYDIAVNRDATRYAIPIMSGVTVYALGESGFAALGSLSSASGFVLSAAYSPTRDELYVAESGNGTGGTIQTYDAQTLELLTPVAQNLDLGSYPGGGLGAGRLRVSRDGQLLMAVTESGVHVAPL